MNARLHRIVLIAGIAFVSVIVLLVVGYSQLMSYLQGDDFRQRLADGMKRGSGAATVELSSNLTINGNRVSAEGVSIARCRNIREARASRISLELDRSALFSRKLHLYKLSMEEASLAYDTGASNSPKSEPAQRKSASSKPRRKSPVKRKTAPAKSSDFSLKEFELEHFECRDADLSLTHQGKAYQLLGANISANPAPRLGPDAWQLNAENARLHTPFSYLRDSSVKSATAVYQERMIDVTECRVMLTPGEMRIKAHYDLKAGGWTTDLQVNKGDVHRILNDDWKKRFSGELYGRMLMTGSGEGVSTATGSFSVQNGVLEGLPFLSQIPVGNTYPYRSIELEKADCQVLFPYNGDKIQNAWLFDKINLRSRDGAFLVHGHIIIGSDRRLGGTLTIGLPRSIAAAFPLSPDELTNKLFTASGNDDNYLWVNMNLSGSLNHPQEDLSIRVATLAGQNLTRFLKDVPKGKAADLLNTLLQQKPATPAAEEPSEPSPAATTPGNLINDAADAAGSLIQSLF